MLLLIYCTLEPPRTPVDPCDRVKFILGEETTDGSDSQHIPTHSLFTELEELCYDEHGDKYVNYSGGV